LILNVIIYSDLLAKEKIGGSRGGKGKERKDKKRREPYSEDIENE